MLRFLQNLIKNNLLHTEDIGMKFNYNYQITAVPGHSSFRDVASFSRCSCRSAAPTPAQHVLDLKCPI
jgi:hypothetical protein